MALSFNGTNITAVNCNDTTIKTVIANGTTVYQKGLEILGNYSYTGGNVSSFTMSGIAVPEGTESIVITGTTSANASRNPVFTGVTVNGSAATLAHSYGSGSREYAYHDAIYVKNISGLDYINVAVTLSSTPWQGTGMTVIFLDRAFLSYTPTATLSKADFSSPCTGNLNFYAGGFTCAVMMSYLDNGYILPYDNSTITAGSTTHLSAFEVPSSSVTSQAVNAYYAKDLGSHEIGWLCGVSYDQSKFIV